MLTAYSPECLNELRLSVCVMQEFLRELNVRSPQKDSAVSAGMRILQLTDSKSSALRRRLTQLEQGWVNLTNMVPSIHQTQQQVGNVKVSPSISSSLIQQISGNDICFDLLLH